MRVNFGAITRVQFDPKYSPEQRAQILQFAVSTLKGLNGQEGTVVEVPQSIADADTPEKVDALPQDYDWFIFTDRDQLELQKWRKTTLGKIKKRKKEMTLGELIFCFYSEFFRPRLNRVKEVKINAFFVLR